MGLFTRRKAGFPGGLRLDGHKLHGERGRIVAAPLPERVILPVSQHIGTPATPLVEVGERVRRGQAIARSEGFIAAPVHASISGSVVAIGDHPVPHPSGLPATAIVIDSDGRDEPCPAHEHPASEDPFALDATTVRERVRAAGLVGLGGAAFPSAVKLNPGSSTSVDTLILNGAECEPYISCDAALMQDRAEDILHGAELIRRTLGAYDGLIGIEDNAPEAATAMRTALRRLGYDRLQLRVIPTRYPQGGEKQLIQTLTGQEVPREGLPLDIGIVVHNVGTAAAIWRALRHGEALISRIVTVTGPGVREPHNLEVRLGTPIADLIDHCGGYTAERTRLIMGGPMMGFQLHSDSPPVVKATNCILVDTFEPEPADSALPCIRCGDCVDVCPAGLLPQQLYWHARAREFDKAQALDLFDCIECGCCAQVCPSHIPLVQYYRYAKTEIYQDEQERRKADIARRRHEFRQQRLEQEQREKEEARRRKREALQRQPEPPAAESPAPAAGNDAVAAAIARAKAEKSRRLEGREAPATEADSPSPEEQPRPGKAAVKKDDPVAAAIARAKARKAAQAGGDEPGQRRAPATGNGDPVAAAIAKAKARKAAKAAKADADRPAQPADAAEAAGGDAGQTAGDDDPVAAAIARAKARKAAKAGGGHD